jgi:hypothetical protein
MLLTRIGCRVVNALGQQEGLQACRESADLMIIGHSVPHQEKLSFIDCFRQHSGAPVLSLLLQGEEKIPEATLGVESHDPEDFLKAVQQILH